VCAFGDGIAGSHTRVALCLGYYVVSREIQKRRKDWVKNFLGDEAAENYQFGDITKKALLQFTGEDDYQFGDGKKHRVVMRSGGGCR
jgi:hypothetical protein